VRSRTEEELGVAIVEGRLAIRENLALLIASAAGFRCAGRYAGTDQALAGIDPAATDVVLVDLALPGPSGVEAVRVLRERFPAIPSIVLTVYEDDERVFDAVCAGAVGCLPKKAPPRRTLEVLRAVSKGGGAPIPPDVAHRAARLCQRAPRTHPLGEVSPDELCLLELLAEGHNFGTAARELGVTPDRAGRLARSVCDRLHASFRTQLVR
jgi:DNA-binding NarL/FixJ family response regulator